MSGATRLDAFHAAIATDNAKTFRGGAQPASQEATQTAPRAAEQADAETPGNVYGTEKTPSQGRYEVSDSGSAQLLHTGEPVSIRSVAEIRDGKMTLELKDGRKVSAEEISYANEDEALVYEAVAEMGVKAEAANVLLEDYSFTPKVNGRVYAKGMQDRFFDGDITADKAAKVLTNHCGWEKADAENKVRYWDFKRSHPDLYVDDAWMEEYDIEIRESGIALETFIEYRNQVKGITGEGKKDRRMAVIDSLPITDEQKDAIYFAEGWAISTLHKAPWH